MAAVGKRVSVSAVSGVVGRRTKRPTTGDAEESPLGRSCTERRETYRGVWPELLISKGTACCEGDGGQHLSA